MSAQTARITPLALATVVDKLGTLKAQMAVLKKQEDALKARLVESGYTEIDGTLFRSTISHSDVASIDWKAIAEYLNPSRRLVTAHTSTSERVTVRVNARKS